MKPYIYLFSLFFLLFSCQNTQSGDKFADCKYGEPKAIFDENLDFVNQHNFKIKALEGIEEVTFSNGRQLTIYQSGCNEIKQDFEFILEAQPDSNLTNPYFWIGKTIEEFQSLGAFGQDYFSYSTWAQVIAENADKIKIAEFQEVQPGFYVKIDRINGPDESTLMVTLSESP